MYVLVGNESFLYCPPIALIPIREHRSGGMSYAEVKFCMPGGGRYRRETSPVETWHYFLDAWTSANYPIILISHFHIYKIGIIAVSTSYAIGRIDGDVCVSELLNKWLSLIHSSNPNLLSPDFV